MKKLHPTTTLGALFLLAALGCLMANQFIASLSLFVLAFFGATREVAIFTSKFQFTVVILAAMGLGISLDLRIPGFPFITIALMIAAGSSVLRISYFRFFSYTGYLWMELSMVAFAVLIFFAGSAVRTYDWIDYSFPSTILIFAFSFALNTLYDSIQLLRGSGAGFQIKAGQLARDFTLPDQNGVPVTLSHFKNDRTVLLIFVRGDWCPMCHMMLRTYDKRKEEFQQKNIMLLAIGPDPVGVNKAMVEKLGVDFRVLSDEAQQTARIYGVQIPEYKNNFAPKQPEGIPLPASFLLDKQQVVRYISSPAKVGEYLNPGLIFEVLKNIQD